MLSHIKMQHNVEELKVIQISYFIFRTFLLLRRKKFCTFLADKSALITYNKFKASGVRELLSFSVLCLIEFKNSKLQKRRSAQLKFRR